MMRCINSGSCVFIGLMKALASSCVLCLLALCMHVQAQGPSSPDPLPSWNEGPTKSSIIGFVKQVTDANSPSYVPIDKRIAVFDNDGTLWVEHPMYTQMAFVIDRIKERASLHPDWKQREPFRSVLSNTLKRVIHAGEKGLLNLVMTTHAGMTVEEFEQAVSMWLEKARHPRFDRPYTELVYEPMREVLTYMRAHGFKTFIASGGGVEFMRPWTQAVYGIPPEQVVGSTIQTKLDMKDGKPVLLRLPKIDFIDDKQGKPVGINKFIGRRPIAAFGNSDGDLQMLQWTAAGDGPRLMVLVHHTDGEREYAYDRDTHFGKLDKALDEGRSRGWTLVDMKKDWKVVFPFEKQ